LIADGGQIHLARTGSIVLDGAVFGGDLLFEAPVIRLEGRTDTHGHIVGGRVKVRAKDALTVSGPIRADGGDEGGPFIDLFSLGSIDILSDVKGDSSGLGMNTGSVRIVADGPVRVGAMATVSADGVSGGDGGNVFLQGCSVNVSAGASVSAQGPDGEIVVGDSDQMTLAGNFHAGPGGVAAIELKYRNLGQEPTTTGATFNITPTIINDPALSDCEIGVRVPIVPQEGLVILAALLLGASYLLLRRRLREQV
jgi:hypothetical protein